MTQESNVEQQPYFDESISNLIDNIDTNEQDNSLKELVKKLVFKALQEIEQKYGKDGEGPKSFHDASHTKEFIFDSVKALDAVNQTRPELNLTSRDKLLLVLSSAYHDVEQNLKPPQNEEESANQLLADIAQVGELTPEEKILSKQLIKVTVFDFAQHKQSQSTFERAGSKTQALEQCMALADLAALGDYERQHWRGNRLAHELGQAQDPKKWFSVQLGFLNRQKAYISNYFGDFPVNTLYKDIDRNIELYSDLTRYYDQLATSGVVPEEIIAKDKKTSNVVKLKLQEIKTRDLT